MILKALNKGSVANRCIILDAKASQVGNLLKQIASSPIEQLHSAIRTNLDIMVQGNKGKPDDLSISFGNELGSLQSSVNNLKSKESELKQEFDRLMAEQKMMVKTPG